MPELKDQQKAMSGQDKAPEATADVRPDDSEKAKTTEEKSTSEDTETKAIQEKEQAGPDYNKLKSKLQKAEVALGKTSAEYQALKSKMTEMEKKLSKKKKKKEPEIPKEWEGVEATPLADTSSPEYQKWEYQFTQKITNNVKSTLDKWWEGQEEKQAETAKARLARETSDAVGSVNDFIENFREENNIDDDKNGYIEMKVLRETQVPRDVSPEFFRTVLEKRKQLYQDKAVELGWAKGKKSSPGLTGTDPEKQKLIDEAKRNEKNGAAFLDQTQPDGSSAEKAKSGLTGDLQKMFLDFSGVNRKSPFQ